MNNPSPGVYTTENNLSAYAPAVATSVYAIVGTASKGPVNTDTLITDAATLVETFGEPRPSHLALYSALAYLNKGSQLRFVRVASYDATSQGSIMEGAGVAAVVSATSSGTWGDAISLVLSAATNDATAIKLSVKYNGVVVEVFDQLKFGLANVASANYVETRINGVSAYITVAADTAYATPDHASTVVTFTGGDDGASVSDADVIGTVGAPPTIPATGLQLFANKEAVSINILAVPGNSHAAVIAAMVTLCESREDCICLIDPPMGKTVPEVVAWSNGLGGGLNDPAAAINSSYAAIFYPWVKVFDGYSNADVWIPPSGHIAGVIAYTAQTNDAWFAPAGFNRARLTDVLAVEHSATQGERDYMYSTGNVINPIVNYAGKGVVVWGQRTATRASSKLDRINVRILLNVLREQIRIATLDLVMEPNDETTWSLFFSLTDPILAACRARRGLDFYNIVCDATLNTPAVRARKEMRALISLLPTDTAEMLQIGFNVINNQPQITIL